MANNNNKKRVGRCCCCLLRILWFIVASIIVLACLVILVFWILIQPRSFTFHVTEANLTHFNYTGNTLHYNLVLNFTVRNPNKKLKIYYDVVQGNAFYEGMRFGTTDVNMPWRSYLQNKKSTDRMSAVFSGKRVFVLDRDQVSDFEKDKRIGNFHIDIKLYFSIRFRLGDFIPGDMTPTAKCKFNLPFNSSSAGKTVPAFHPTKCVVDF